MKVFFRISSSLFFFISLLILLFHGEISFALPSVSQTSFATDKLQFYSSVTSTDRMCPGITGGARSFAGYIGLDGDSDDTPKRSFFWYFEAESNPSDAPIILSFGGGPGTSGLVNPLLGQSPCIVTKYGELVGNPNRWTEKFNLIALDHPVGVGFSYGSRVNNSRSAAIDVYDFLQKFFILYPELIGNQLVVSGGSYGGIYVPNVATVIQEQNRALAAGKGKQEAVHINLESVTVSNPISDALSRYTWLLQYRCVKHQVYNSTTCNEMYALLPDCIEAMRISYLSPSPRTHERAFESCIKLDNGDSHGTVIEDIRRTCLDPRDVATCHPVFSHIASLFHNDTVREIMGIPGYVNFTAINEQVTIDFLSSGDRVMPHHLLYEQLMVDGIRVLHWVGKQDANCDWLGVLSFLKLLRTPYQEKFMDSPDIPWESIGTVRSVGSGAGDMTFILLDGAGHFVVQDGPEIAKNILERWIENRPFIDA